MKGNKTYTITNFNDFELYHLKSEVDYLEHELRNNMEYLTTEQPEYYYTLDIVETLEKVILLLDELVHLQ